MENNLNNNSAENKMNTTAKGNSSSPDKIASANSSNTGSTNSSQSAQGKSNQQATSGKDSLKNIQGMLQQYSRPIAEKINGLTTTQKIVGGSILALGAGWIAMNSSNKEKIKSKASELTSKTNKEKIKNKANELASTAQQKMNENKGNNSSSSNATRTGSSAVDARVK